MAQWNRIETLDISRQSHEQAVNWFLIKKEKANHVNGEKVIQGENKKLKANCAETSWFRHTQINGQTSFLGLESMLSFSLLFTLEVLSSLDSKTFKLPKGNNHL